MATLLMNHESALKRELRTRTRWDKFWFAALVVGTFVAVAWSLALGLASWQGW